MFKITALRKEYNLLEKEDRIWSDAAKKLRKKIDVTKDNQVLDSLRAQLIKLQTAGESMTPQASSLNKKDEEMTEKAKDWEFQYILNHVSLVSYSLQKIPVTFLYGKSEGHDS